MKLVKALCVVLLLYSTCFGECRTMENNSNLKKRMMMQTNAKSPKIIAQEIEKLVRRAYEGLSGKQQFGYIYIQPFESDIVTFDDSAVVKALLVDETLSLTANHYTWPQSPHNTNFRIAVPDFSKATETNYGHSEYQLLTNDGLGDMLETFIEKHDCPQYVILYSTLLPCMFPPKYAKNPGPRCAEMTVIAKKTLKESCPGATFYVYTNQVSDKDYPDAIDETVKYFKRKGIFWLNPKSQMCK